jgi:hypothetical protein
MTRTLALVLGVLLAAMAVVPVAAATVPPGASGQVDILPPQYCPGYFLSYHEDSVDLDVSLCVIVYAVRL